MNLTSMNCRFSIFNKPLVAAFWDLLVVYCAYTLCRAIFLKHNPAYRVKATKAHVKRDWPWNK